MQKRQGVSLFAVLAVAGCTASSINFDTMTAEDFVKQPQFMEIRPTVPDGVTVIGEVKVEICNKRRSDKVPTKEDVILLVRLEAAKKGATRMSRVTWDVKPEGTNTCFAYASASGVGYIHNDDPD
jgi:hypothetical protein